jgi:5'-deoxynucleotidase YfbR-like HD superfamily hydrolase
MRYSLYAPVYYRSSDFLHSKRVAWLVESVEPIITEGLPNFDIARAVATALVHDDAELLVGDIQAGNKGKMSKEELQAIDDAERKAIDALAEKFPKTLGGYNYKEMLEDVLDFTTPEAQVVKYLDRFDALGEALHELYAGS